jgi:hypothetical protein
LIFGNGLGQYQFCAQTKRGRKTRPAVDDGDWNRIVSVFPASANIKNQLCGRQIFAVDQNQIETLRIKFLGCGNPIQRALASYRHFFQNTGNRADSLVVRG